MPYDIGFVTALLAREASEGFSDAVSAAANHAICSMLILFVDANANEIVVAELFYIGGFIDLVVTGLGNS